MKTIKIDKKLYKYDMQPCEDYDGFAVMLDLGNGKPECIGYASDEREAENMIVDEIETLSE